MWIDRIKQIHNGLMQVEELKNQKNDLEVELVEAKKKILIQEKDLKDKIVVKEVLEKRIGELQLRVEQISGLESEIKRLNEKLKNSEEGTNAMEEEIDTLLKKKAHVD
jgi:predicted  nucleic acid-binding Zn-ribbon protein